MPELFNSIPSPPDPRDFSMSREKDSVTFAGKSRNRTDEMAVEKVKALEETALAAGLKIFINCSRLFLHVFFGVPVIVITCFLVFFPPTSFPYIHILFLGLWCLLWRFLHQRMSSLPAIPKVLAEQPWVLTITPVRMFVTQQQGMTSTDYRYCSILDIQSIELDSDGYLVANLLEASTDQEPQITLTGSLRGESGVWLQRTLRNLLYEIQSAAPLDRGPQQVPGKIPDGLEVTAGVTTSEFTVRCHEAMSKRIVSSVLTVVVGVGLVALFFGAAGKTPLDIRGFPFDKPFTNIAVVSGVGMAIYIAFTTLNTLFGQTRVTVCSDSILVKKSILAMGITRHVGASNLKAFKQVEQPLYSDETEATIPPLWGLVAEYDSDKVWLLKARTFSETDWLGRRLACLFDVPLVKTSAAGDTKPIAIGRADYRALAE